MDAREFDVVIFGATGFTGRLVAGYLSKVTEPLSWAIAGRNATKLATVKAELGLDDSVGVISADTSNPISIEAMTARTRVLATTVGPYARYGEPVVAACVATGTHYADITGEPSFVNDMINKYDAAAAGKGLRIVNCCGFDSIPHDFGAYVLAKSLPADVSVKMDGVVSTSGSFSGGTWQSAVEAMGNVRANVDTAPRAKKNRW